MEVLTRCSFCGKHLVSLDKTVKYIACVNCHKFTPVGSNSYGNNYSNKILKGGCNMEKEKVDKGSKERKSRFGSEIDDKVCKMFKDNKTPRQISKELGGHPGVPKCIRILKANKLL